MNRTITIGIPNISIIKCAKIRSDVGLFKHNIKIIRFIAYINKNIIYY